MNWLDAWSALGVLETAFALRLTQAILYFAGQGLAIGLLAAAANWSLQGASSRLRYDLNVAALVLMLACLPVTFACLPAPVDGALGLATRAGGAAIAVAAAGADAARPAAVEGRSQRSPRDSARADESDVGNAGLFAAPAANPREGQSGFTPMLRAIAPATAAIYLFGVALMLLRVSVALWGGHRLRCSAVTVTDAKLLAMIACQARRLGMRTAPAVAWCQRVSVPVVVGLARPLVLLPTSLASGLSLDQLEALLTHELAHIRRYDLLVNLLQRLAEALLFFHPAVWYVSRQVSIERESCCDDLVVVTGCGRLQYADALVRMAELCAALRLAGPVPQAALLAASGDGPSQFKRRVLHLLEVDGGPQLRLTRGALLLTVLLPASLLLAPALVPGGTERPLARAAISAEEGAPEPSRTTAGDAVPDDATGIRDLPESDTAFAVGQLVAALSGAASPTAPQRGEKASARTPAGERLALFMIDLLNGDVTLVAKEPKPDFTYCGSPSWSRDGGRVMFDATPGTVWSQTHLQILDAADGRARLTDLGLGNCPSLSPDGKRIAFLLNAGTSSQRGVWIMQSDGSGRRRLGGYGVPRWSPDGRQLLVSTFGTPCKVTLIGDNGLQHQVRLAGYEFRSVPHWGGDGATLVATVHSAAGFEIALVDVSQPQQAQVKQVLWRKGGGLEVDLRHPKWGGSCPAPAYHAASGRLVFVGGDKNGAALYTLQVGAFDPPRRLEAGYDNQIAALAFSPDGRYVLFCSDRLERFSTQIGATR